MRTQHNHNNDNLHGSWHLLAEKSVRMRGINSTFIGEKFMVVLSPICCFLLQLFGITWCCPSNWKESEVSSIVSV